MNKSPKVSKEVLRKVEGYLRAGTFENGAIKESLMAISGTLGLSSATVHRAVEVLRADGRVSITPPRVPGLPQEIKHLTTATDIGAEVSGRLTLDRIRLLLSDVESEMDRICQEHRALQEELAIYRDQNSRVESKTSLDDGRVIIVLGPSTPTEAKPND